MPRHKRATIWQRLRTAVRGPEEPVPNPLFGVDRFIVMEGVVVCDGWFSGMTEPDAQLELLFDGAPLPVQQLVPVDRLDLIELMRRDKPERLEPDGEAPRRWGFCIRALLPLPPPPPGGEGFSNPWDGEDDDSFLRLSLCMRARGAETLLEDPANTHLCAVNEEHAALLRRFRQAISESTAPRILEIGARGSSPESCLGGDALPSGSTYIGMDYYPGENVTLVGDAHRLSELLDEPVDFVFSVSTFEHLLMPWKVAVEISRVLRLGGLAFIHSHSAYPLHEEPHDFFRFSKFSWAALFNRYTGFELIGATHADPAVMSPALHCKSQSSRSMSRSLSYLTTGCLARKISEPEVDWTLAPDDIVSTAYPQPGQ